MIVDNIEKAIKYGLIIIDLVESDILAWKEKYDAAFWIYKKLIDIGFKIDYCDPDTSYGEDVVALSNAISKHMKAWCEIARVKQIQFPIYKR